MLQPRATDLDRLYRIIKLPFRGVVLLTAGVARWRISDPNYEGITGGPVGQLGTCVAVVDDPDAAQRTWQCQRVLDDADISAAVGEYAREERILRGLARRLVDEYGLDGLKRTLPPDQPRHGIRGSELKDLDPCFLPPITDRHAERVDRLARALHVPGDFPPAIYRRLE